MKKIKILLFSIITSFIFIEVSAVRAGTLDFSVNPVLPSNQVTANEGYFDLLMSPGASQTVKVELINNQSKAITVDIAAASATTNVNGVVVYSPTTTPLDKSLKYNLAHQVELPNKITLQPKATQTVSITANMPNSSFDGVIAGGITFKEENQKSTSSQKGMTVDNVYQYVLGFLMRQNKTNLAPTLTMNNVQAAQVNYRNVINATLQNSAMAYLKDMNVNATVQGISDNTLKYTYSNSAMEMAPNSSFNLPIPVSIQGAVQAGQTSQPLKAGKYQLSMTVYGQKDAAGNYQANVNGIATKYDYKWTLTRDFTVSAQEATKLNSSDLTVPKDNSVNILLIVGLILIFLLILLIIFLILHRRKKAKETQKQNALENELAEMKAKLQKIESKEEK